MQTVLTPTASVVVSNGYMTYFETILCNSNFELLSRVSSKCLRQKSKLKSVAPLDAVANVNSL